MNSTFRKADLVDVYFNNLLISDSSFSRAEMRGLKISNTKFNNCLWDDASLYDSIITDSWIKGYYEMGSYQKLGAVPHISDNKETNVLWDIQLKQEDTKPS